MRVIVCGGRDYTDRQHAFAALDAFHAKTPITCVIAGGARGADTLAVEWARARSVQFFVFPARWNDYGKAAGSIRNAQMLYEGAPQAVIAFPGGRGTADMVRKAEVERVPVHRIARPTQPPEWK